MICHNVQHIRPPPPSAILSISTSKQMRAFCNLCEIAIFNSPKPKPKKTFVFHPQFVNGGDAQEKVTQ